MLPGTAAKFSLLWTLEQKVKKNQKNSEKKKEKQQQTNENPSYFASVFLLFCRSLHRLQ